MSWRRMPMKYPGTCTVCGQKIDSGEVGLWAKGLGVKHEKCAEVAELRCVVCGGPAGCPACEFEDVCNIPSVSQLCICKGCSGAGDAPASYRKAVGSKFPALGMPRPGTPRSRPRGSAPAQTKLI